MKKFLTIALLASLAAPASADISRMFGKSSNPKNIAAPYAPPKGYDNQHWVSPNECTYSRAQAPGYAPTWHLVLNGTQYGLTDAHSGCAIIIRPGW